MNEFEEKAKAFVSKRLERLQDFNQETPWDSNRAVLRKQILKGEKEGNFLSEFLKWPTIRGTMYVGKGALAEEESIVIRYAYGSDYFEEMCCRPNPHFGGDVLDEEQPEIDPNLVHQAYHLYRLGNDIDILQLDTVLEMGAGIGHMVLLFFRAGFQGVYTVVDYPEMLALQRFALQQWLTEEQFNRVRFVETLPGQEDPLPSKTDLFIAIASLSETPVDFRKKFIGKLDFKHALIYFTTKYDGVNNYAYFAGVLKARAEGGYTGGLSDGVLKTTHYLTLNKDKER